MTRTSSRPDLLTVVGARPQFIKAAIVSRALSAVHVRETIVHTGQHYDPELDAIFFEQLKIPTPATNLRVGSASHAVQTSRIMLGLDEFVRTRGNPRAIMLYGDTNSTLAGALVATKLQIPILHVEAGLRSYNRRMPEETNRVLTDHVSSLLFCPTSTAVSNLAKEGIKSGVVLAGDVMRDSTEFFSDSLPSPSLDLPPSYALATVHRAENTDDSSVLAQIVDAFGQLNQTVMFPAHPRTRSLLGSIKIPKNVNVTRPLGYLEMLSLIKGANVVLTDSGGLQKEAYWLGVPCVTLREETEWEETLEHGWNRLVGSDAHRILTAVATPPSGPRSEFGRVDSRPASSIVAQRIRDYLDAEDHGYEPER